jgi:hypothetical protein
MVSIWGSAVIAGSFLGVLETATGSPASAFDRRIELTNNTRMAIVEIQIAQVGTGRWERDLLGDDVLLPAQSVLVDIDDGKGHCRFDIKTVFDDGTTRFGAIPISAWWRGLLSPIDSSRPCHRAVAY